MSTRRWSRRLTTSLALLVVLLGTSGCRSGTDEPSPDKGAASVGAAEGPQASALRAPPPPAPGQEVARAVQHFENMALLAEPLREDFCDELGADLTAYLALAQADLDAVLAAAPDAEARAPLAEAYRKLTSASTRCINDPAAREFNKGLLELARRLSLTSTPGTGGG